MATTRLSLGIRRRSGGDTTWMLHAECQDQDPEMFFPVGKGVTADQQATAAKAVCRRCPVMAECLEWALTSGQEFGVWGGHDEDERRELRRLRRRSVRTGS